MALTSKFIRIVGFSSTLTRSCLFDNIYLQRLPSVSQCKLMSTKNSGQPSADESGSEQTNSGIKDQRDDHDKKEDELQNEIKKLQEDLKDHKEKYMRSIAETENMRKRLMKQTEDAKIFGIQSFCKDLLEVSDVLNTAINAVPNEELTDSNPHLKNLYQGLNMTETQLLKVFQKHGLVSISPKEGDKFDPHIHEALFQVPIQIKETQEADTVAAIQKIGFKLHERTIRPALVGVFKGS